MADQNEALLKAIDSLPYDDMVKADLFDAYHADSEETAKNLLKKHATAEKSPMNVILNQVINAKMNNDPSIITGVKETSQPPVTANIKPPVQQSPSKPEKGYLEQTLENAPRSAANLVTNTYDTFQALGPVGIAKNVVNTSQQMAKGAKEGYVKGGVKGAIEGTITQGLQPAVEAGKGVLSAIGNTFNRLTSPLDTFKEDPFGLIFDVATLAIPEMKAFKAGGGLTKSVSAGVKSLRSGEGVVNAAKATKEGFKTKPVPPSVKPKEQVTSSISFDTNPVAPSTPTVGPIGEYVNSKKTTKVEGTAPLFDKSKRRVTEAPVVEPSVVETEPPPVYTPAPKLLEAAKPKESPRFYADETGQVLDTTNPPQVTQVIPAKQIPGAVQPKQLPAPEPNPGELDIMGLADEYKVQPAVIQRFGQLEIGTLEHIASQADDMVRNLMNGEVIDPSAINKASETSRAARAVLQQRSYREAGLRGPLDYSTSKAPIPGNAAQTTAHLADAKPVPVKSTPIPEAPKPTPNANQTPVTPKSAKKAPKVKAPEKPVKAEVPAAEPSSAGKTVEKPQPQPVAETPVTPKPVPEAQTVVAEAPKVETVASPVPETLPVSPEPTVSPVVETPLQAETPKTVTPTANKPKSSKSNFQIIQRDKNGKANYREGGSPGSYALEKDEVLVTRPNSKDAEFLDKYVVKVNDKGVSIIDENDTVVGKFPKGTTLEDAVSKHFGSSPIPEPPKSIAKSEASITTSQPPTPPKSLTKQENVNKSETRLPVKPPVSAAKQSLVKAEPVKPVAEPTPTTKGKDLKDKIRTKQILEEIKKTGETKELKKELINLVGDEDANALLKQQKEIVELPKNTYRFEIKGAGREKYDTKAKVKKLDNNNTQIDLSGESNFGNIQKESYSIKKDGDVFYVIDKSKKRIASYTGLKSMDEAIKLATEKLKVVD